MNDATTRFERAIAAIDALHEQDPERIGDAGAERVRALRLTEWLHRLVDEPSEPLQLAVRAQHLCRWETPRSAYPPGRAGYKRWRRAAMAHHAERVASVLRDVGYDAATISRVQALVQKKRVKQDPEAQALEDAVCLVFLEHELAAFRRQLADDARLVDILRKTWAKMSERARAAALQLPLPDDLAHLVHTALDDGA